MSAWMLDQIATWAAGVGYFMEREIGCVLDAAGGRLDAVLCPVAWDAPVRKARNGRFGLVGVECKGTRPDFLKGLKGGQFERYRDDKALAGLYVATYLKVAKTSELPAGVGHLVYARAGGAVVCKRHPKHVESETPAEALFNLICRMRLTHISELQDQELCHRQKMKVVGELAGATIFQAIREFEARLKPELSEIVPTGLATRAEPA